MPAGDPPLTLRDLDAISAERVRSSAPRAFPHLGQDGDNHSARLAPALPAPLLGPHPAHRHKRAITR